MLCVQGGNTPLKSAQSRGQTAVVALLQAAEAADVLGKRKRTAGGIVATSSVGLKDK